MHLVGAEHDGDEVSGGMGIQRALINKATLKLICDTRNVTAEYISRVTKCKAGSIEKWKDPQNPLLPTIRQAKAIARCLNVPFAGLYMMPQFVPVEKLPKWLNKRTFQGSVTFADDSALNLAMFELLRLRRVVLDTRLELKDAVTPFVYSGDLSNTTTLASQLRDYLGVSYEMQKATTSSRKFFLLVRSKIEGKGVMVAGFDRVPLETARGMALYFDEFPIIGVNSDDRPPAKTFSMLHELVHVLKRQSAACNEIGPLPSLDEEEVFCNAVAGEFLVPADLLQQENEVSKTGIDEEAIETLASRYSVSREVITRRLLDLGRIQPHEYETMMESFRAELEAERNTPRNSSSTVFHRNMVREAFDRNGTSVCRALQNGLDREIYSQQDIGDFLGIKLRHIPRLFEEASRW